MFAKKEIGYLPEVLREEETILFLSSGSYKLDNGLVVATDKRLFLLSKEPFSGFVLREYPYEEIVAIRHKLGLVLANVTITTSTDSVIFEQLDKEAAPKLSQLVSKYVFQSKAETPSAASPSVASSSDDVVAKLERLAALKEKGLLTDQEFVAQKAKLLG
jgi:hypothetical protein